MRKALVVSASKQDLNAVVGILREENFTVISAASAQEEVKALLEKETFDLVFVNAPLKGGNALETALCAAKTTRSCVVAAINGKYITDEIVEKCTACGILVIGKPIDRHLFHHYLMFVDCLRSKMTAIINENDKLKNTVEEIKLVDRAKCLLIETLSMTETQAHRYLEKQAMDMRLTKLEIAKQIIKTYGI